MRRFTVPRALVVAAALAAGSPALSSPILMKFDGVDGELQVESAQIAQIEGQASQAKPKGGKVKQVQPGDFHFTHLVDKASPVLMKASTSGRHFPTATIVVRKAGRSHEYLVIKMTDVIITSVQPGGTEGGQTEKVSLHYGSLDVDYAPPAGTSGVINPALSRGGAEAETVVTRRPSPTPTKAAK